MFNGLASVVRGGGGEEEESVVGRRAFAGVKWVDQAMAAERAELAHFSTYLVPEVSSEDVERRQG